MTIKSNRTLKTAYRRKDNREKKKKINRYARRLILGQAKRAQGECLGTKSRRKT